MPYGMRGFTPSGTGAEGDKFFAEFVYNDTSGALSYGQPVYVDTTDAAEFNNLGTTAFTAATKPTGGNVVLGTNANAGANLTCVGVFQPTNPGELPVKGDPIRVLMYGRGVASVQSPAAGAAGNVGSAIIASAAVKDAVPGARAAGLIIGIILATRGVVTVGTQVIAAASATSTLVNAFVNPG
jgi:hypothetical protein